MQPFIRGVALPFQKGAAPDRPVADLTPTQAVRIPLARQADNQHPYPDVLSQENAVFAAGQPLYTDPETHVPTLATVSGELGGAVVLQHPLLGDMMCAELLPEGQATATLSHNTDREPEADDIIAIARQAAIYDELDGEPLWDKLAAWQLPPDDGAAVHSVLVADATENDVFGSAAWSVLQDEPEMALMGLQLAAKALRFTRYHIATLLPRDRRRTLKRTIGRINVFTVDDEYPVTEYADGQTEVFRIGIQACLALAKAVREGKPSTTVVVTVAGDGIPASQNVRVPYGTDLGELLAFCHAEEEATLVLGDAMTGVVCPTRRIPLLPGVTTLLVMRPRTVSTAQPCIGCGRCAAACHAQLLPYEIVRRLENMHYERLQHLAPWECDGCGVCSYVCPSMRPVAADVLRAGETDGSMFLNWEGDDRE